MNQERYTLEWRGVQKGPWTLNEIEHLLSEGDIHSLHKIQVDGRWLVLRDFLEDQRQHAQRAAAAERAAASTMAAYAAATPPPPPPPPPPPQQHPAYYPAQETHSSVQEPLYPAKRKKSLVPILALSGVGIVLIAIAAGYLLANFGRRESKTEVVAENKSVPKAEIKEGAKAEQSPPTKVELPVEPRNEPKPEPKPAFVPDSVGMVSVVAPGAEFTSEQLSEKKTPFVVQLTVLWASPDKAGKLETSGANGSGVYLKDEGSHSIFITNRHVVEVPKDAQKATGIMQFREEEVNFEIIAYARYDLDLAKIRIKKTGAAIPPMDMATLGELKPGQECVAIGNALGEGISITTGVISAFDEWESVKYIRTSAPISPGNSGGGLFRKKDGKLIGITTQIIGGAKNAQNFNQAIPVDYILSDLFWEKHTK